MILKIITSRLTGKLYYKLGFLDYKANSKRYSWLFIHEIDFNYFMENYEVSKYVTSDYCCTYFLDFYKEL